MEDKNANKNRELNKQKENADQGFTVRDGHNPNKPNPYEKPVTDEPDIEQDDIIRIPDDYDVMEGDEHEEDHHDKKSKK